MKYYFTVECLAREWACWEVEAATFEGACAKFGQLREEGEPGEVVDSQIVDVGGLVRVEDENGTPYDPQEADELAWLEE
jgi:hypothetical protein